MSIVSVERTNEAVIIKLPLDASADYIQNILNYLKYVQTGVSSEITPEQINELASEAKEGWWKKNKARFEGVDGFEDLPG